jgi:hypothetical protein
MENAVETVVLEQIGWTMEDALDVIPGANFKDVEEL